ncbi:MAG: hypothetical protein ACK4NR_05760 [Micavibrio sp.]
MNNQKLMTIAIIVSALILSAAIAYVQISQSGLTGKSTTDTVSIEDNMRGCTKDDQCIVVDTKCSFCCDYTAINSKFEPFFNQLFDQTCKTYRGAYCECQDLGSYPACVNGICQMVQWSAKTPVPQGAQQTVPPTSLPSIPAAVTPPQQPAPVAPTATPPAPTPAPAQAIPPVTVTAPAPKPEPAGDDLFAPLDTKNPTPPPAATTTPPPVPATSPAPAIYSEPTHDAFGEDEVTAPVVDELNQPFSAPSSTLQDEPFESETAPQDDLFSPLPDNFSPPAVEDENVEIIQP